VSPLGIGITQNGLPRTLANITRASREARLRTRLRVERAARLVERDVKQVGMTGTPAPARSVILGNGRGFTIQPGAVGNALAVRTGRTRRSVTARVFDVGPEVVAAIGSPEKYMRIQEQGGTIAGRPFLAIPATFQGLGARGGRAVSKGVILVRSVTLRARRIFAGSLDRQRGAILEELKGGASEIVAIGNGRG
jgi:hypothetical protein